MMNYKELFTCLKKKENQQLSARLLSTTERNSYCSIKENWESGWKISDIIISKTQPNHDDVKDDSNLDTEDETDIGSDLHNLSMASGSDLKKEEN